MSTRFTMPVFGEGGELVAEIPVGQQLSTPLPILRDPVAEAEAAAQKTEQLFYEANPRLYLAHEAVRKTRQTREYYAGVVNDLRFKVSTKSARVNSDPGTIAGAREELAQELRGLQAQLADMEEEYLAATEEETAAREALAKVMPA